MSCIIKWACPVCRNILIKHVDKLICTFCEQTYPIINGIPIFSENDNFYEGKYSSFRRLYHGSIRANCFWKFVNKIEQFLSLGYDERRRSIFERFLPKEGLVIDLGCGGGWDVFLKPGLRVIGCDISYTSLETARIYYFSVFQGDISNVPFPDCYFDVAVCSDVLGHIKEDKKKKVISEIYRVIRPGGTAILTIETESKDPLTKICRKFKKLYYKYFLSPHGHFGLKYPSDTIKDFKNAGFCIKYIEKTIGLFWPIGYYFENIKDDYLDQCYILRIIGKYSGIIVRLNNILMIFGLRWLARTHDIFFGLAGRLADRILPMDMARGIGIVIQKPRN